MFKNIARKDLPTWVLVNNGITPISLANRIRSADLLISDLDDTDAPSPAMKVIMKTLPLQMFTPKAYSWIVRALPKINSEESQYDLWHEYVCTFLSTPEAKEKIALQFNKFNTKLSLYEGVWSFYCNLPLQLPKHYVTRNILSISEAYSKANYMNAPVCDCSDKLTGVKSLLEQYTHIRSVVIKEDSPAVAPIIKYLLSKGINVLSIQIARRQTDAIELFDAVIPRDYRGLNALLDWN